MPLIMNEIILSTVREIQGFPYSAEEGFRTV